MLTRRAVASDTLRRQFSTRISVNGRDYNAPQTRPVMLLCLSGTNNDYIVGAREAGAMPHWDRILLREGFRNSGLVAGTMPTVACTNHASILSGVQSDVHGVTGNSYFDTKSRATVGFNAANQMRCPTILSAYNAAGHASVFVSVHQNLLDLLDPIAPARSAASVSISIEEMVSRYHCRYSDLPSVAAAHEATIPDPTEPEASLHAIDLATRMILEERGRSGAHSSSSSSAVSKKDGAAARIWNDKPSVYYVAAGDALQRRHAPGEPEANAFFARVDAALGKLDASGVRVAITSDYGMNHKMLYSKGQEHCNIVYVQSLMTQGGIEGHLALPVETGDYSSEDELLSSYATIYLKDPSTAHAALAFLRQHRGIYSAFGRDDACASFALPPRAGDRVGDIVLVGDRDTVLGREPHAHDLARHCHHGRLRAAGSLEEATVPLFVNFSLAPSFSQRLSRGKFRAYDAFDVLMNGAKEDTPLVL